ncbi:MAG TPA: IS4 family transposase, partial [Roseibacterium sp.]|nr:IS4 family transposase [Roseibacterium sp.]
SQLLQFLSRHEFESLAKKHHHGRKLRSMSRWSQFLALATAQLTGRCSLRDITANLRAQRHKLYHLGCGLVSRSSLARVNEKQPHALYEEVFGKLLAKCQGSAPSHSLRFKHKLYSLDASMIELTCSLFPWAKYQRRKGAIELHVGLDHDGFLPTFIHLTEGRKHEIEWARTLDLPADSVVVFDRGFNDYSWWKSLQNNGVRFVTRLKKGTPYVVEQKRSTSFKKNVVTDQVIRLTGAAAAKEGLILRSIGYRDPTTNKHFVFLTNDLESAATTIAEVYRQRWQIELFFKWIKQNLKVKTFLGRSVNAVMTQLWIAMIVYLMLAFLKFQNSCAWSLSQILRLLQLNLFERRCLLELLEDRAPPPDPLSPQIALSFA